MQCTSDCHARSSICAALRLHEHRRRVQYVTPATTRVRPMPLPCFPLPPNVTGDHHASCYEGASRPPAALPCCLVSLSQHVALSLAFLTWRLWLTRSMMSRLHTDSRGLYKSLFQEQSIISATQRTHSELRSPTFISPSNHKNYTSSRLTPINLPTTRPLTSNDLDEYPLPTINESPPCSLNTIYSFRLRSR